MAQITRRAALIGGSLAAPAILRAQGLRKVRFTLQWVAQGSTLYPQVAQEKGFWRKRGLDVSIARGYGSFPAVQAIAADQFDFGISQFPTHVLAIAKSLPVTAVAVYTYSLSWAIALRADSPIQKPSDLAGKTIGGTTTASDYIFLPEYLRREKIDPKSVTLVQLDSKILEQAAISKQVDAISCVVSSTAPVFMSQNVPARYLQYSSVGLDAIGHVLVTQNKLVEKDPDLVAAVTDGLSEAVQFVLGNPDESLDLFIKAVPEIALTTTGREFAKIGLGTFYHMAVGEPLRSKGIGAWDDTRLAAATDLVVENLAPPGTPKPTVKELMTPGYAGKLKVPDADWAIIEKAGAPYDSLFLENKT